MHMCKRNATSPHNRSTIAKQCAIYRANICNRIGCARIVSSTGLWSEMLWDGVFMRLCAFWAGPRRHAMLLQQPINGISFHRSVSSRISRDHPSTTRVLWMAANDRGSHFCEVEIAVVCLGSQDADAIETCAAEPHLNMPPQRQHTDGDALQVDPPHAMRQQSRTIFGKLLSSPPWYWPANVS